MQFFHLILIFLMIDQRACFLWRIRQKSHEDFQMGSFQYHQLLKFYQKLPNWTVMTQIRRSIGNLNDKKTEIE